MNSLDRRRFLAALGLGCLAGPRAAWALPGKPIDAALSPREVSDSSRAPLRFVGIYTPHGRAHELWQPGAGFDLTYPGCSLAPFDDAATFGTSFKSGLLVVDGLDLSAGIEVGTVGHDAARVLLTGSGANGKNASIDQYLASERGLGRDTPHTSLVLGVGNDGSEMGSNISYAAGGTPMPKLIDPALVFDELFGKPLTGKQRAELEALRRGKQSALDFLHADLATLRRQAPAGERLKLEQHTTALFEIEKRLSPAVRQCSVPPRPDAAQFPKLLAYGGGEPHFERITELQIDLLARALSCDLTRFASLFLADLSRTGRYPEMPRDVHQEVAHLYKARSKKNPGDAASWAKLALQNRDNYAQVARLLQRLHEASSLDDTVVYVSSDMGDPAKHSSRRVPTVVYAGSHTGLAAGRYVDLRTAEGADGVPHNRLLVSLCQTFGVPTDRFGSSARASTVTGTLAV